MDNRFATSGYKYWETHMLVAFTRKSKKVFRKSKKIFVIQRRLLE
jgi:hypothetical protein